MKHIKHHPLTNQANLILSHMILAGSISQREALLDYSVQSLTRRMSELRAAGYGVKRVFLRHPMTNQRYARYSVVAA